AVAAGVRALPDAAGVDSGQARGDRTAEARAAAVALAVRAHQHRRLGDRLAEAGRLAVHDRQVEVEQLVEVVDEQPFAPRAGRVRGGEQHGAGAGELVTAGAADQGGTDLRRGGAGGE